MELAVAWILITLGVVAAMLCCGWVLSLLNMLRCAWWVLCCPLRVAHRVWRPVWAPFDDGSDDMGMEDSFV